MWKRHVNVALACAVVVSSWAAFVPGEAHAATESEIEDSIEDGVAYLVAQQSGDGSWQTARYVGTTGLALAVLGHYAESLGEDPLDSGYVYSSNYQDGLDYIFSPTSTSPIRRNPIEGRVWWGSTPETGSDNYVMGPALMAIVMSGTPDRVVDVPGSAVDGMTYRQVVEEVVNFCDYSQIKVGNGMGSWDYTGISSATGDQSIAGWVTLGLGYAGARFDVELPPLLLNRLDQGIDIIQWDGGDCDGGAGYRSSGSPPYDSWINCYKTGHLLYMMGLVGDDASSPRVQRSLAFLERHWMSPTNGNSSSTGCGDAGWRGNPPFTLPSYIATAAMMKGLLELGIDMVGPYDWYDDFSDVILAQQAPDGSWTQGGYPSHYDPMLHTSWALLTLLKAAPERPAPTADFAGEPRTGRAKLTVGFSDLSSGDITSWRWYFGDGGMSTRRNPTHTYSKGGTYTVKLTVSGPEGSDTVMKEQYIRVTSSVQLEEPEPASLGVSYLFVDPVQVLPNQEVTVSANVCNNGEERGSKTVSLMLNGEAVDSQTVSVSGGACQTVVFKISRTVPGTYQVAIEGMAGQFSVLGPRTVTQEVPANTNGGLGTAGIIAIIVVALVLILALILVFRRA